MFTERVQSSRAQRKSDTRVTVLANAEQLFRSQSFAATTVRDIAQQAQVSTGTVMSVGDKNALLVAVFDEWISAVHDQRLSGDGPDGPVDLVEHVVALLVPFIEYFLRDPELSREYAAIAVHGKHRSHVFDQLGPVLIGEIADVIGRHRHSDDAAIEVSTAIYFAYIGVLLAGASSPSRGDEVATVRRVVECIINQPGK